MSNATLPRTDIPTAILQQALEWQVNFWSGESSDDERRQFERWLNTGPQQQDAWRQVQAMDARLLGMASPATGSVLRDTRKLASRRRALRSLLLIGGAGLAAYGAQRTPQWQTLAADYRTGRGEQREITLPDGGRLTLNTDSAVDVIYDDQIRRIHLLRGEILIVTVPDSREQARPFVVDTRQGRARAIGTRFTVRQEDGRSAVAVSQGIVELRPHEGNDVLRLNAGEHASFDDDSISPAQPTTASDEAWLRGLMIAERMPLRDFLANLSRYRSGLLRCDDSAADMIVSGVFSVRDTDQTLAALLQILPIRITYATRYWVSVAAAP